MTTSCRIFKDKNNMWILKISAAAQFGTVLVTKIERSRLIELIEIAGVLRLHVDNQDELPLKVLNYVA